MRVSAQFGGTGAAGLPALQKIYDVTKEGDNVNYDYVTLEPSSSYLLLSVAETRNTGAVYGQVMHLVSTPTEERMNRDAVFHNSIAAASNTGATINWPTTTQIQWRTSGTAYRVRLRVYKIN